MTKSKHGLYLICLLLPSIAFANFIKPGIAIHAAQAVIKKPVFTNTPKYRYFVCHRKVGQLRHCSHIRMYNLHSKLHKKHYRPRKVCNAISLKPYSYRQFNNRQAALIWKNQHCLGAIGA